MPQRCVSARVLGLARAARASTAAAALLGLGLLSPAGAARAATVVVSNFQAMDGGVDRAAAELGAAVERELGRRKGLELVPLDRVPAVGDVAAVDYASSCPPGEAVGCAFVLGEAGKVSLAVAALVRSGAEGATVEVHIIDVQKGVDVLSFLAELGPDDEVAFAEAVAAAAAAVASGEVKAGGDIRAAVADTSAKDAEKAAAQQQLNALNEEMGGGESAGNRRTGRLVQKRYTMEDIAKGTETDGTTPWERIGMGPEEYLKFKNSGMGLRDWRERSAGRRGQLLLRPWVGFGRGPYDQAYEAYQGVSAEDLSVIQTDVWQATLDGSGVLAGASVGYGLLPGLEVGLGIGQASGKYALQINRITEGQTREPPPEAISTNSSLLVNVHALGSFFQTAPVRPVAGGMVQLVKGSAVDKHSQIDPTLPTFPGAGLWQIGAIAGVEARMGDRLDLYMHVPLTVVVGGDAVTREQKGAGVLTAEMVDEPPALGGFGAGALFGVQVRLFKPRQPETKAADEDPDF